MHFQIAYCPTCRTTRNVMGRKTWRKSCQTQKRQYTHLYHCTSCTHFVFSERLPRQSKPTKEIHYGFGAHRT